MEPKKPLLQLLLGGLMSTPAVDIFAGAPPANLTRLQHLTREGMHRLAIYRKAVGSLPRTTVVVFDREKRLLEIGGEHFGIFQKLIEDYIGSPISEAIRFDELHGDCQRCPLKGCGADSLDARCDFALQGRTCTFVAKIKERVFLCDVGPVIMDGVIEAGVLSAKDVTGLL